MKTTKYLYGLSALLLSAALGSCAYESEKAESPTFEKGTFTLNVTTGSVGAATTRTVTSISSDAALTDTKADAEKKVSSLVWGIYHAAAGDDQGKKVLSKTWTTPGESQTAFTVSNQNFGSGALRFEANDHVLVAANLSATELAAYAALTTKTDFQQKKLGIREALTGGTGALDPSKLPMFGTSTVTADTETEFSSNVTVNHLVAKVTLNSLSVNFTGTGHASATFKPLEVFLINVPDELTMEYDGTNYTPTGLTLTNLYQGENHDWTAHASADKRVYADYLGTGTVYDETLDGTATYSKRYSLYTMPYNFTETSVTNASDNTRLVIKGEYRPSGGTAAVEPMYYAVNLNNGTGDYKIKPNTHYKVTATIKGPGADNAYDAIPLYQNFTANVDYEEWTEEATTATIGNGGINWSNTQRDPVVGDLYFSDGTWGTKAEYPSKTPIGIVFSTSTSAADQALGYNRGYVMALRNVDYYAAGGPGAVSGATDRWILKSGWCADIANVDGASHNLRGVSVTGEAYKTALAAVQGDMDGLTHCQTAKTAAEASANYTLADLYAINAAMTYFEARVKAPASTAQLPNSGWYLPSIGQQYQWVVGLGNAHTTATWTADSQNPPRFWYVNGGSQAAGTAINTAMENAGLTEGTDFDKFRNNTTDGNVGEYFWSSTERTEGYPFNLRFSANGNLSFGGNDDKSDADRQVRAVLAF